MAALDRHGSRRGSSSFPFNGGFGGLFNAGNNAVTLQSLLTLANQLVAGITALIQAG